MKTSNSELASLLGLTEGRIRQLQGEGVIPKGARMELGQCIRAYCAHLKRSTASSAFQSARTRKLEAEAELAETKLAEEKRRLVSLELVVGAMEKFLVAAKIKICSCQKLDIDDREEILRDLQSAVLAATALDPESGVRAPDDPLGETTV